MSADRKGGKGGGIGRGDGCDQGPAAVGLDPPGRDGLKLKGKAALYQR